MTYVVVENTPGYLPEEDEPAIFATFEEAEGYADERAREAGEQRAEHDSTANVYRESETLWRITSDYPHTLDRVVEILEEEDGTSQAEWPDLGLVFVPTDG